MKWTNFLNEIQEIDSQGWVELHQNRDEIYNQSAMKMSHNNDSSMKSVTDLNSSVLKKMVNHVKTKIPLCQFRAKFISKALYYF